MYAAAMAQVCVCVCMVQHASPRKQRRQTTVIRQHMAVKCEAGGHCRQNDDRSSCKPKVDVARAAEEVAATIAAAMALQELIENLRAADHGLSSHRRTAASVDAVAHCPVDAALVCLLKQHRARPWQLTGPQSSFVSKTREGRAAIPLRSLIDVDRQARRHTDRRC